MPKPKKIINDPKDAVDEFIAGLLYQFPNRLKKLANHHVVLTASPPKEVQLLSGGGSGHEPSHAGWIGPGMLSGAILGGIFASPSVSAVLAAVRAASNSNGNAGVLLIVKNYTGDRLNFGMACEKACQEGIACKMVVVADDCALERTKGITGARGVAGTVLVHKIAGAAATAGKTLDEIVDIVSQVSLRMGTLGVALDSVTVPGADTINDRLDDATIEIGMGIHGEAGIRQAPLMTASEIATETVQTIQKHGRIVTVEGEEQVAPLFQKGDELCVLVNNLGGTSNFEMSILANAAVLELEGTCGARVTRLMVGSYMTSFECHGASITILNLSGASSELVTLLDSPCDAPAWIECDKNGNTGSRNSSIEIPEIQVSEKIVEAKLPPLSIGGFEDLVKPLVLNAAKALGENEALLTKYDTIVGDGDCGITMKRGATEVETRLNQGTIDTSHPVLMFAGIADAVSSSMGGTSGVLLELCFRKMSSTLSQCETIDVADLRNSFQAGVDAICLYGGASIGSRTMLDALIPAAALLVKGGDLTAAASEAKDGADGTSKMKLASAGRSNYLSEETLEGTPDPGAVAVAIVFVAIC